MADDTELTDEQKIAAAKAEADAKAKADADAADAAKKKTSQAPAKPPKEAADGLVACVVAPGRSLLVGKDHLIGGAEVRLDPDEALTLRAEGFLL